MLCLSTYVVPSKNYLPGIMYPSQAWHGVVIPSWAQGSQVI